MNRVTIAVGCLLASAALAREPRYNFNRSDSNSGGDTAFIRVLPPGTAFPEYDNVTAPPHIYSVDGRDFGTTGNGNFSCPRSDGGVILPQDATGEFVCVGGSPRYWYPGYGSTTSIGCFMSNTIQNAEALDLWTLSNTTVAANVAVAPDGRTTMDRVTSTVNGGYAAGTGNTQVCTGSTNWTGSIYVQSTDGGTQAGTLIIRDTTAGVDRCTVNYTAGATASRVLCRTTSAVGGNGLQLRVYPGGVAGTGSHYAWGGQYITNNSASSSDSAWMSYEWQDGSQAITTGQLVLLSGLRTPRDNFCMAFTAEPRPYDNSFTQLYAMCYGRHTANNSACLYISTVLTFDVQGAALKTYTAAAGPGTSALPQRFCACMGLGTAKLYQNGIEVTQAAPSGAGTGLFSATPTQFWIGGMGSLDSDKGPSAGLNNLAIGPNTSVCAGP